MKKIILFFSLMLLSGLVVAQKKQKTEVKANITSSEIWIDRFDKINGTSITNGTWFAYNDKENQGASSISPINVKEAYREFPERNADRGMQFSYQLDKGKFQWDPYVGVGINISDTNVSVSTEQLKGIAYDYKGSRHQMVFMLSSVKDYAHYRRLVPESEEWTTIVIPITEFRQPSGWGRPVDMNTQLIQALQWMMVGRTGDTGTLCIDNIRLLRKLPKPQEIATPAAKPVLVKPALPQAAPVVSDKVEIATWPDYYKAAYSLTFDDGLISQYVYVRPTLQKYQLNATFYVMPPSFSMDSTKAPSWRFGYWHQFAGMSAQGHEIGAHTMGHTDLTALPSGKLTSNGTMQYELAEPIRMFAKLLPNQKIISFAYPFGKYNETVQEQTSLHYASARALGNGFNPASPPNWMNLQCYSINYAPGRTKESDLEQIRRVISGIENTTIPRGGWSLFLAHDVMPFAEAIEAKDSWQPVSLESLDTLAKWLNAQQLLQKLWVAPVGDVTRYIRERQATSIKLTEETSDKMVFAISDTLSNEVYNFPLTISVKVPEAWTKVVSTQNGKEEKIPVKNGRAVIHAVPDKGAVELRKE